MDSTQQNIPWTDALSHMRSALYILDQNQAPGRIGAFLDLAITEVERLTMETADMPAKASAQLSSTA